MTERGTWVREPGARLEGSRPFDRLKVQAPCAVRVPGAGWRLFYTAIGPERPFPECQGCICSAVSEDGLSFRPEPGFRLTPDPLLPHCSLRVLAPSVTPLISGGWRMYFEARGPAAVPRVICSAFSNDLLRWTQEPGIRWQSSARNGRLGGPRFTPLPDGRGWLVCCESQPRPDGRMVSQIVSATADDGLRFSPEPNPPSPNIQAEFASAGITAAQVIPPDDHDSRWTMLYSAWQDLPPGRPKPLHPSLDPDAVAKGTSADFAAASIACDLAGYRSRIFQCHSSDGLSWGPSECVLAGAGYGEPGLDAIHAEDMQVVSIGNGQFRMYYAACDAAGRWRIVSAARRR